MFARDLTLSATASETRLATVYASKTFENNFKIRGLFFVIVVF